MTEHTSKTLTVYIQKKRYTHLYFVIKTAI